MMSGRFETWHCHQRPTSPLWIPAFAGMTLCCAGMTGASPARIASLARAPFASRKGRVPYPVNRIINGTTIAVSASIPITAAKS